MFASLPFILLLILQGFARQDCAELLLGSQDLANIPVQAKSLRDLDKLFVHLSLVGKDQKENHPDQGECTTKIKDEIVRFSFEDNGTVQSCFLSIQRSRDGPIA
jgi:hypothetical protein